MGRFLDTVGSAPHCQICAPDGIAELLDIRHYALVPQVEIQRAADYWGMYRRFVVFVDGRRSGVLKRGQSMAIHVAGNRPRLQVRSLRAKSAELFAAPGDATFVCGWRNLPGDGLVQIWRERKEPIYLRPATPDEATRGAAMVEAGGRTVVTQLSIAVGLVVLLSVAYQAGVAWAGTGALLVSCATAAVWIARRVARARRPSA